MTPDAGDAHPQPLCQPLVGRLGKDEALAALRAGSLHTEVCLTERLSRGTELAYEAAIDAFSPIIAAGDNTDQGPGPDG